MRGRVFCAAIRLPRRFRRYGARVGAGRFRFYHGAPCLPQGHDAEGLHQFLLDRLSAMIVSLPGQYFWHHKRFKYRLPASARKQAGSAWRDANILRCAD